MIEAYTAHTPKGRKLAIMLEETGLSYRARTLDIAAGETQASWFRGLSPNGKVPVIRDCEPGRVVWESGAILIYLAEKTGRLLPAEADARLDVLQWLFFQVGSVGPMSGQFNRFRNADDRGSAALTRYDTEVRRLLGVLNEALSDKKHIAGCYSIADIALLPWIRAVQQWGIALTDFPDLARWYTYLGARPAVQRGFDLPAASQPLIDAAPH